MMSVEELQHLCLGCMKYLQRPDLPCPHCGWNNQQQNKPLYLVPGSILAGRYLVGKVLGEGGFGVTYVGWSMIQNKKVAIKEFFPDSKMVSRGKDKYTVIPKQDRKIIQLFEDGKKKFFDESQTLARFDSDPNIVNVEDFFLENNTAYIVMEFLNGQTFMNYLANLSRPLNLAATLTILNPVISALERIHEKNLLHRDISPDNIMLTDSGTKLLDFGAARGFSLEGEVSNTVYVKLGYAPQEQFFVHGNQGPWTDEHALAATIYHAITGYTPPPVTQRSGNFDPLKPPSALGAVLTSAQEIALLRGMAMNYKDRYPTIKEFRAALTESDKNNFFSNIITSVKSIFK